MFRFHRILSQIFQAWHNQTQVTKKVNKFIQKRAIQQWKTAVSHINNDNYNNKVAVAFNQGVVKLRAFCALVAFTEFSFRQKEKMKLADNYFITKMFRSWRIITRSLQKKRMSPSYLLFAGRFFDTFVEGVAISKAQGAILQRGADHHNKTLLLQSLYKLNKHKTNKRKLQKLDNLARTYLKTSNTRQVSERCERAFWKTSII